MWFVGRCEMYVVCCVGVVVKCMLFCRGKNERKTVFSSCLCCCFWKLCIFLGQTNLNLEYFSFICIDLNFVFNRKKHLFLKLQLNELVNNISNTRIRWCLFYLLALQTSLSSSKWSGQSGWSSHTASNAIHTEDDWHRNGCHAGHGLPGKKE